MKLLKCLFLAFFACAYLSFGQSHIVGRVFEPDGTSSIGGVTIYAPDSKTRTYTSSSGFFRIKTNGKEQELVFSSIGYERLKIKVKPSSDTLSVKLKPTSVRKREVSAIGFMSVEQIIERAIKKKEENMKEIKTLQGLLYSKVSLELDGKGLGMDKDGNSASIGTGGEMPDKYKMFILETFSKEWHDFIADKRRNDIIQRRQTANIEAKENLVTLGDFINFYSDEIKLVNATLPSPIGYNALKSYNYKLLDRLPYDDKYIYSIEVSPKSELFPAFYGTIKIIEESYDLVDIDLQPSESAAITFVDSLRVRQKFEEVEKGLWYPAYVNTTGKARVEVIKGMIEMKLDLSAVCIYSELKLNETIADTVFKGNANTTNVVKDADSVKKEFWENNSLREITPKEKSMYGKIDSIVVNSKSDSAKSEFKFSDHVSPYLAYNRSEAFKLGATIKTDYSNVYFETTPFFSTKNHKFYGDAWLYYNYNDPGTVWFNIGFHAFNKARYQYLYKPSSELLNTVSSLLFQSDDFDYHLSKGGRIFLNSTIYGIDFRTTFEISKQTSDTLIQKKIKYLNNCTRYNPSIEDGDYRKVDLNLSYGAFDMVGFTKAFQYRAELSGLFGQKQMGGAWNKEFRIGEAKAYLSLPTFGTGYGPIMLRLAGAYGKASNNTPPQFMITPQPKGLIFATYDDFFTVKHSKYAGTEKISANAEINFTDIWWRAIGLPLYEKRGLELIISGGAFKIKNENKEYQHYLGTDDKWLSEVGFGLGKIPVFFSNVLFLRLDMRWSIQAIKGESFGIGINISSPL